MKFGKKGFTLIELLVVIAIIGILATIVLVAVGSAQTKARDAQRIGNLDQIRLALEMYAEDSASGYPASLDDLDPTYMAKVPKDPGGDAYLYGFHINASAVNDEYQLCTPVPLEVSGNKALQNDADMDKTSATGWTNGCDGTDNVYDLYGTR